MNDPYINNYIMIEGRVYYIKDILEDYPRKLLCLAKLNTGQTIWIEYDHLIRTANYKEQKELRDEFVRQWLIPTKSEGDRDVK